MGRNKGYKHSLETIKKISGSKKGQSHPQSKATKEKISKTHLGIKNYWWGKTFSSEHKSKLSISHKGSKHWNWKGEKKTNHGYIFVYMPDHPFSNCADYIREHRLVAEKVLGRYLTNKEQIHHINGIKSDNRPENLYLFPTASEHTKYEMSDKKTLISNLGTFS